MTKEQNLPPRPDIPSFWRNPQSAKIYAHLGENPFGPSKCVLEAIIKAAMYSNHYPDTNALQLREQLAQYVGHGVSPENIIVGNGSDELIDLTILSFATPDKAVLTFEPSFFVYRFCSTRHGISVWPIRRTESFDLPQPDDLSMAETPICITFIANPNNPTGTLTPRDHLINIIDHLPGIVVIDECYYEFCSETVVDLINDYKNLIVLRSLSKSFGLSGLRLGYAVAHEEIIDIMASNALTFPVNAIAQAAGIAAIDDIANYQVRILQIIQMRDSLAEKLTGMGLEIPSSHANFLLTLWPKEYLAKEPAKMLAEQGIYVSDQTKNVNLDRPALRIGIGTAEENDRIVKEIDRMMR